MQKARGATAGGDRSGEVKASIVARRAGAGARGGGVVGRRGRGPGVCNRASGRRMRAPGSRLRGIAAHLAPTAGEQVQPIADAEVEVAARLLTEEQLAQFVVNGFIAIELTDLPLSFHEEAAAVALAHADSWAGGRPGRPVRLHSSPPPPGPRPHTPPRPPAPGPRFG